MSYMGPTLAQHSGMQVRKETGDVDRWLGVDSEWQVDYLFHSSLGDSLSILDRLLCKGLAVVKSDLRPGGYCNVFT